MRILVTGGSGFIGSNIAARLVEMGHEVYSTSSGGGNDPAGTVIYRSNLGFDWGLLPSTIDAVFHQSANNDTLCNDIRQMMWTNVRETEEIFNRLYFFHKCRKFVYASSTAVYGASPAPYIEGVTETKPLNIYGESKLQMEEEITRRASGLKGAVFIGFRYCNVYGPGEQFKGRRASMIYQLIRHKLMNRVPKLFKDGEQRRDWVHVQDVVNANILALNHHETDIFNLGSGKPASFNELIGYIGNQEVEWVDCPFADKYQTYTCCDLTKIGNRLGYSPKRFPEDAIPEYIQYLSQI